ncbi:hypothetical protein LCGC14_1836340 [marine sediment metagenome]|uniref:Uncharacterized protein n=1 Tax=marine sediment metagenome TaxID=412755 RepID=A0A0F9IU07_9ZZZZ
MMRLHQLLEADISSIYNQMEQTGIYKKYPELKTYESQYAGHDDTPFGNPKAASQMVNHRGYNEYAKLLRTLIDQANILHFYRAVDERGMDILKNGDTKPGNVSFYSFSTSSRSALGFVDYFDDNEPAWIIKIRNVKWNPVIMLGDVSENELVIHIRRIENSRWEIIKSIN